MCPLLCHFIQKINQYDDCCDKLLQNGFKPFCIMHCKPPHSPFTSSGACQRPVQVFYHTGPTQRHFVMFYWQLEHSMGSWAAVILWSSLSPPARVKMNGKCSSACVIVTIICQDLGHRNKLAVCTELGCCGFLGEFKSASFSSPCITSQRVSILTKSGKADTAHTSCYTCVW